MTDQPVQPEAPTPAHTLADCRRAIESHIGQSVPPYELMGGLAIEAEVRAASQERPDDSGEAQALFDLSQERPPLICAACGGTDEPVVMVPLHPYHADTGGALDVERLREVLAAAAGLDPVNESVRIVRDLAQAEYESE